MNLFKRIRDKFNCAFERLTFRPFVMVRSVDGEEIYVYINNLFAKHWYQNEHVWPEMVWLRKNLLSHNEIVFDCGANCGYTSVFFIKAAGGVNGKVLAFEPHPTNVEAIHKNIQLNHLKGIEVVNAAVGSKSGELFLSKHPNGSITPDDKSSIKVNVVTLDQFAHYAPTFIKIDVEGFELEVLKGATNILKTLPKLDIEIHTFLFKNKKETINEILELINLENYECWIQSTVDGPILSYEKEIHTVDILAKGKVIHLFANPKSTLLTSFQKKESSNLAAH